MNQFRLSNLLHSYFKSTLNPTWVCLPEHIYLAPSLKTAPMSWWAHSSVSTYSRFFLNCNCMCTLTLSERCPEANKRKGCSFCHRSKVFGNAWENKDTTLELYKHRCLQGCMPQVLGVWFLYSYATTTMTKTVP